MGQMKREMEEQDDLRELALRLLLEVGALQECENHDGVYYDGGADVQDAYKAANSQITSGTIELPSRCSRRDFTDLVKSVYDDNAGNSSCYVCDKNFADD